MRGFNLGAVVFYILLVFAPILIVALFGPQSGWRSRLGLGETILPVPPDAVKFVTAGRTDERKYLVYVNQKNEVILREYKTWGTFEAEYKFDRPVDATGNFEPVRK
jgi:hypothetical protein